MRIYAVFLSILLLINPVYAVLYRWTDEHKIIHFSDTPHRGALEMELAEVATYSSPHLLSTLESKPMPLVKGQKITIIQPTDQATIRNSGGSVSIVVAVKPKLTQGDKLQVLLDGVLVGYPKSLTHFFLAHINRGEHRLVVQRVDRMGIVKHLSQAITIYMMPPKLTPLKFKNAALYGNHTKN